MGYEQEVTLQVVTLGNDNYTATTDNKNVAFVSATDEGQMTFRVLSEKDPYTVNVTVTDGAKVSGTFQLTVNPTVNPFTPEDLETLCSLSYSTIYVNGVHDDHYLNEHSPYWFMNPYSTDPVNWINTNEGGMHTFGWELTDSEASSLTAALWLTIPKPHRWVRKCRAHGSSLIRHRHGGPPTITAVL